MEFEIDLITVSENNVKEFWAKRYKRSSHQKRTILSILAQNKLSISVPCKVCMIRLSPRSLDSDNLQGAFKYIRDAIADYIIPGLRPGQADSNLEIEWEYAQQKSKKKGIKLIFTQK